MTIFSRDGAVSAKPRQPTDKILTSSYNTSFAIILCNHSLQPALIASLDIINHRLIMLLQLRS
jgi:hypothetical protein